MNSVIRNIFSIYQHPLCKKQHFGNTTEMSLQIKVVLSIFSLVHMSCHWGIFGHIWVQICTNFHYLVIGYRLVAIDSIGASHFTYEVFLISPISQSTISILLIENDCCEIHWRPYQTLICFRQLVYDNHARCILLRVTGVSRSVANLRC